MNSRFFIPDYLKPTTIVRRMVVDFTNSLNGMEGRPGSTVWKITAPNLDILRSATRFAPKGTELDAMPEDPKQRLGNLKQVVLFGAEIESVHSSFPCPVGVKITGCKGNYYTNESNRYAYVVQPQQKSPELNKIVATTSGFAHCQYLQSYPGMTRENVSTHGILPVPGENYLYIDQGHPVMEVMADNAEALQINMADSPLVDERWVKVEKDLAERCLSLLKNQLLDQLPVVDFTDFNVSVHRVYNEAWTDSRCLPSHLNPEQVNASLSAQRDLSMVLTLTYAFQ